MLSSPGLADPASSNPFGVGARITVYERGDGGQTGEARFSGSYGGSAPPEAHFGLGPSVERVDRGVVDWPDGGRTVMHNVLTGHLLTIPR